MVKSRPSRVTLVMHEVSGSMPVEAGHACSRHASEARPQWGCMHGLRLGFLTVYLTLGGFKHVSVIRCAGSAEAEAPLGYGVVS